MKLQCRVEIVQSDIAIADACSYKRRMATNLSNPVNCTSFRTKQLDRYIARFYDIELSAADLKTTQYTLLTHVLHRGPISTGELALRLGIKASTLTRNMQILIANDFISPATGQDARVRLVSITRAGKTAQARAHGHWAVAQQKLTDLLGTDTVESLHQLIDACSAKLQKTFSHRQSMTS